MFIQRNTSLNVVNCQNKMGKEGL